MTIHQILGLSSDEISKYTDSDWLVFFKDKLPTIRPELIPEEKRPGFATKTLAQNKQFTAKVNELSNLGIDVSYLLKRKNGRK